MNANLTPNAALPGCYVGQAPSFNQGQFLFPPVIVPRQPYFGPLQPYPSIPYAYGPVPGMSPPGYIAPQQGYPQPCMSVGPPIGLVQAEMAQQSVHHPYCNPGHRNWQSGVTEDGYNFMENYKLDVDFDLECLGCCFAYLRSRNYEKVLGAFYDRVCYSQENLAIPGAPIRGDMTNSFVKVPKGGGRRGQIATGHDLNLGELTVRAFANSRTYQLYSETGGLSIGFVAKARMESVAIDVVRPDELVNIYLNYADAALVELYRVQNNQESLSQAEATGFLLLRNPDQEGH